MTYVPPDPDDAPSRAELAAEGDTGPAAVDDHAFVPNGAWYTVCAVCKLAEAAHTRTTINTREP